jgi:hypothetical protein
MPTVAIPIPKSSAPGVRPQESAGRIINGFVEPLSETAPSPIVHRRAAGLKSWGTTSRSGFRGAVEIDGVFYAAFSGQLEKWTSGAGGASTNVGALTGTSKGFFAFNNASPRDKVFVSPDGDIAIFTPTSVTNSYPDGDLPAVNSVCAIAGYLVFTTGNGRAYASDLNSTAINALSFGAAEAKADGLTRGIAYDGNLFLFGPQSLEIWQDVGTTPFPFQRSTVVQRGLAGPYCVAGHEDGFGRALCWVGDDNAVYRLNGYTPDKISSPDLDGLIEAVTDKSLLTMSVFISRGHAYIVLSSSTWTWVFDLNNGTWAERISYNLTRARMIGGCKAFTTKWLCGDVSTGNVHEITNTVAQEVGSPFRWRLESGPVEKFPTGARVGRADFGFVTGVGIASGTDPIQTDPTVELSWSDDGGNTWSSPIQRKLGRQSIARGLVSLVSCTGKSSWNGRRWRLDIADPVDVGFLFATQAENARATDKLPT